MKYIALLRGVNVGGKIVKMERLRTVLADAGLRDVKTYIQSGNVVFESDEHDSVSARALVESVMEREFFPTPVMIRTRDELVDAVKSNPFANEDFNEKMFHIAFMNDELPKDKVELLMAQECETESFAVRGREIYCFLRAGVADSTLGKRFLETKLKVSATSRNWRTIGKILEL
ncbi:MAG TPA: DUF1697 domain-containing protein [Pyrinomonadaceae bacterium]|nr:DUF1697 domain-containing protein [Pyrinomonadaceae bacterium]